MRKWRVPRDPKIPPAPWTLDALQLKVFRRNLLRWFGRAKRDLPWRRTRDPYHIWISEIMLQQTRVAAVIPYYEKFLRRFPNIQSLARARTESVLQLWAGLGYYSRARNLHRAAKEILARHGGKFPHNPDDALKLSGIGEYTAAAVLSIAYDVPLAVLDGNVARVLARLGAIRGDLREPNRWRKSVAASDKLLAHQHPGDWNQAMMDLGATVCTPKSPNCPECPVAEFCRARTMGIADDLPLKRNKRATKQVTIAAAVLVDPQERTLLVRAAKRGASEVGALFSNLWQFPAVVAIHDAGAELLGYLAKQFGQKRANLKSEMLPIAHLRHTVTFREITLAPFLIHVARLPETNDMNAAIVPLHGLKQFAVSSATKKIAVAAAEHLSK